MLLTALAASSMSKKHNDIEFIGAHLIQSADLNGSRMAACQEPQLREYFDIVSMSSKAFRSFANVGIPLMVSLPGINHGLTNAMA